MRLLFCWWRVARVELWHRPPGAGLPGHLSPAPAPGLGLAAATADLMALSAGEHLALTCIVLFLAALGAGFLPMSIQAGCSIACSASHPMHAPMLRAS